MSDVDNPVRTAESPGVSSISAAHRCIAVVFAVNGAFLGTWAPRLPEMQARLQIGPGLLGLTLLALAAGSLAAMPATGWFISRNGSRAALLPGCVAACLVPGLLGLVDSVVALSAVLLVWGLALGSMDVAMNAQAVTVQEASPHMVINAIHACFSLGGLLGAVVGTGAAAAGVPIGWHLASAGLVGLVLSVPWLNNLLPETSQSSPQSPQSGRDADGANNARVRRFGMVTVLCGAAFAAMLAEGSAVDWSAIRVSETGIAEGWAGVGYIAFAAMMLLGRSAGDAVAKRMGHARMTAVAAGMGCVGACTGMAFNDPIAVTAGFAALGLGLAPLMPFLFTVVGQGGHSTGAGVAAISTCGYLGMLAGPALIGGLAELWDVSTALWLLPLLLVLGGLPALTSKSRTHSALVKETS